MKRQPIPACQLSSPTIRTARISSTLLQTLVEPGVFDSLQFNVDNPLSNCQHRPIGFTLGPLHASRRKNSCVRNGDLGSVSCREKE